MKLQSSTMVFETSKKPDLSKTFVCFRVHVLSFGGVFGICYILVKRSFTAIMSKKLVLETSY